MAYIQGTTANDSLTGTGSDDVIYGDDSHDFLYGLDGNDTLIGGYGNDTLDGGTGGDTLSGGEGNDTYYVDSLDDVVVDFWAGYDDTDIVYVSVSFFDAGSSYLEQIHYSGNGPGTMIGGDSDNYIGTGDDDDWLEGRGGDDFLFSGLGDDHLEGGAGNDELDGWQGSDTMIGGTGNDIYNVDNAGDVVTEYAGEGIDTVKVRKSSYTLPTNIENADLRFHPGSISVTGNSADNVFVMGVGAQSVYGGSGNDTMSYAHASAAVGVDLLTWNLSGEAEDDYFNSIENLIGSDYDDELRALGTISVIDGGLGADTMQGRNGSDIYYVDNVGDVVIEVAGGGNDEVRIRNLASYTLTAHVEKLTNVTNHLFTGTGNGLDNELNGGSAADLLYGDDGHDILNGGDGDDELHGDGDHDILNGGAGSDAMYGGYGNDTFYVEQQGDTVVELIAEGTDTVYTTLTSYTLSAHVENLSYSGAGDPDLDFTGSNVGNIIGGRAGDDILDGQGGPDELYGMDGDDVLNGGSGDDLLAGGSGTDVLFGGDGGDLFQFAPGDVGLGASADVVTDFVNYADKVDLRSLDANSGTVGDQAFCFIGTADFSGTAGELRYMFDGTDTWVQGDVTGDGVADFEIVFTGSAILYSTDFYL